MVDIHSEHYKIARRYMIRIRRDDFKDPHELAKYAAVCGLTIDQFREKYEFLVKDEPPQIELNLFGAKEIKSSEHHVAAGQPLEDQ